MDVKVYLAGKITDSIWRDEILGDNAHILEMESHSVQQDGGFEGFPVTSDVISSAGETFGYSGPYFVDATGGHGALLESDSHGLTSAPEDAVALFGKNQSIHLDNHCPSYSLQYDVYKWCHNAILHSDIVFAWVDDKDLYGTFVEVGLASAYRKELWLGFPNDFDYSDLWFMTHAGMVTRADSAAEAFHQMAEIRLSALLRNIPYDAYLTTNHWQRLRQSSLEYAEGRCQLCNDDENLHVHHRTYERRGFERPADLTVLCAECHAHFHQVKNGRPTKMPVRAA